MTFSVPDRRGETWEQKQAPGEDWGGISEGPERFIVVGEPVLREEDAPEKPGSWWHPVLWVDDCGPSTEKDPEQNGMNETYFTNGMYVRLG